MRIRVEVRDEVDDQEWSDLLGRDPRAHCLQRPVVTRLIAEYDRAWSARWLEVRDEDGRLRAGLGFNERTRYGLTTKLAGWGGLYSGPVAAPDDAEAEALLARAFLSHRRVTAVHRELVWAGTEPPRGNWDGMRRLDAAVLDVDPDRSFQHFLAESFTNNRRNEGNRSDRRGLRLEVHRDGRALAAFHPLYVRQAAEWGTRAIGLNVLEALVEELPEAMVFATFDADQRVCGAHVCFDLGHELFAWVGTTERRRDVFPSTVIVREEARWCHANGRRRLNLGSSIGRRGIEGYKRAFGARWDVRWIVDEDRRPWRRRAR